MNQVLTQTTEKIRGQYDPEVGNMVGVFGLTHPGAAYGIISEVYAHDEETGAWDVRVTWYAPKTARKRSHAENKKHNATGRIVARETLDAIEHAMEAH